MPETILKLHISIQLTKLVIFCNFRIKHSNPNQDTIHFTSGLSINYNFDENRNIPYKAELKRFKRFSCLPKG